MDNDPICVIVTERPNRVWVTYKGEIHAGRWATVNPGENGIKDDHTGNRNLLNAAMYSWDGQPHFTTTLEELELRAGGWPVL